MPTSRVSSYPTIQPFKEPIKEPVDEEGAPKKAKGGSGLSKAAKSKAVEELSEDDLELELTLAGGAGLMEDPLGGGKPIDRVGGHKREVKAAKAKAKSEGKAVPQPKKKKPKQDMSMLPLPTLSVRIRLKGISFLNKT